MFSIYGNNSSFNCFKTEKNYKNEFYKLYHIFIEIIIILQTLLSVLLAKHSTQLWL